MDSGLCIWSTYRNVLHLLQMTSSIIAVRCIHLHIVAPQFPIDNKLTIGYIKGMSKASDAAKTLALRSVAARRRKWGEEEFRAKMREWGKLGGRPKKEKTNAE